MAQEILSDPLIVTAGDVSDFLHEKYQEIQERAEGKLDEYRKIKSELMDEKKIHLAAVDRAFDGRYLIACSEYAKLSKKMEEWKPKMEILYGDAERVHELAELSRKYQKIVEKRREHGKQIGMFRKQMQGDCKEKIAAIEQEISVENAEHQRAANRIYGEYKNLQKQLADYDATIRLLETGDMDKVLFSEKLPRMLTRHCKIDGARPVGKCKTLVLDGCSYALLDKLPTTENLPLEQAPMMDVFAVRLGDEIQRGNVPKYLLKVSLAERGKWKIQTVQPVLTKEQKPEMVHLYPAHAAKKKPVARPHSSSTKIQAAHEERSRAKIIQISRVADSLLQNEKSTRLDAHWSSRTDAQDKAMREEEQLYMGWGR